MFRGTEVAIKRVKWTGFIQANLASNSSAKIMKLVRGQDARRGSQGSLGMIHDMVMDVSKSGKQVKASADDLGSVNRSSSSHSVLTTGGVGTATNFVSVGGAAPTTDVADRIVSAYASSIQAERMSSISHATHVTRGRQVKEKSVARTMIQDFEHEIATMTALRHPNIVMFMGACLDVANMCIVTELCLHGSLAEYLAGKNRAIPWHQRMSFALDSARGMTYLHSHRPPILHRDLKSPNLLLDNAFRIKITDFGLAQVKDVRSVTEKLTGSILWIAPEVFQLQIYNESADAYSFGE
eukprot:Opistho-2@18739